jgi:hypothetical protein
MNSPYISLKKFLFLGCYLASKFFEVLFLTSNPISRSVLDVNNFRHTSGHNLSLDT